MRICMGDGRWWMWKPAVTNTKTYWTAKRKTLCICKIIYMEVFLIVFPPCFLFLSMSTPSRFYGQMDIWNFFAFIFPVHISLYNIHIPIRWSLHMNEKCLYTNAHTSHKIGQNNQYFPSLIQFRPYVHMNFI